MTTMSFTPAGVQISIAQSANEFLNVGMYPPLAQQGKESAGTV